MRNVPIFYVMGVSSCGKSTIGKLLAQKFEIPFFDGDDYHPKVNVEKMATGNPLNDDDRRGWLERLNTLAHENINQGAVIACSALKESYRTILKKNISEQTEFVYLEGTYDEILKRMQARENHFMPAGLLKSQFDTLEIPSDAIAVSISKTPKEIIIAIVKQYANKKP